MNAGGKNAILRELKLEFAILKLETRRQKKVGDP
jgi:hypothetical protein